VNGGLGIALGTKWHGKFFAEARYDRIFMGNDRHARTMCRLRSASAGKTRYCAGA
jgi:hypothetical protein